MDLDSVDLPAYRALTGYVPQEALLFSGTLRENVDFGTETPDAQIFQAAMEAAQLKEEMESFPDGEKTIVGQRGISLSGGQKQRMAIARAIVKKPKFLLFDDITASLDAANEERLMRALAELNPELTYIVVSHRLSTLQYVDKVLFIDRGKILGFGTHEQLMELPWYRDFIEEHMGKKATV
jgi:ATP-binding cassette subfamily B protein